MDTFTLRASITNNSTGEQVFDLSMTEVQFEDIVKPDHATPGIDDVVKVLQGACEAYATG